MSSNLKTDYRNDILNPSVNERRKFQMINNPDGTVSFEDVTVYETLGDTFGAADINSTNREINKMSSSIDTISSHKITQHPVSVVIQEDCTFEFACNSFSMSEIEPNYRWQYAVQGSSDFVDTTTLGKTFKATARMANSGRKYRCKITDNVTGEIIYTDEATLTVIKGVKPLMITTQPTDVSTVAGQAINISVGASGKGSLSYQWYYKNPDASTFTLWSGRTTATLNYSPSASKNGMQVHCVVSDENGSATSATATITVL